MVKEPKNPKQRILETATSLFAQKGYTAVGVREIAKNADVNISMISYYFNGKAGILEVILEEFSNRYFDALSIVDDESLSAGTFCPIITDMIFAKFRRMLVIKRMTPFEIDDAMYERYADAIADLFLYGITGITNPGRKNNNEDDRRDGR